MKNRKEPIVGAGRRCHIRTAMALAVAAAVPCAASAADESPSAAQNVKLGNGILSVEISPLGAELRSVRMDGCEYIWQRDPAHWSDCAPVLFPICGSLYEGRYTFGGREYAMGGHGFASKSQFRADRASDGSSATFSLESDDATRARYPFDFSLAITFRLEGAMVFVDAKVRNTGAETMPFTYGGHPGFNVPLGGDGDFGDWFLEFAPGVCPDAFEFGNGGLITGRKHAFPLAAGNRLPLRHELFNGTGLFLDRTGGEVTLRSDKSSRSVTVRFPDMPNLGFWHSAGEAPFLCIEPWCGLPSYDGVIDDFATRPNMIRLAPGAETTLRYSIECRR